MGRSGIERVTRDFILTSHWGNLAGPARLPSHWWNFTGLTRLSPAGARVGFMEAGGRGRVKCLAGEGWKGRQLMRRLAEFVLSARDQLISGQIIKSNIYAPILFLCVHKVLPKNLIL